MEYTSHSVERKIGEALFRYETGKYAQQADGAVMAQVGESAVLVTATASKTPREGGDFFPLTIDVEERMYAAGKIPGGVFRREGRAGEKGILTARLIDRPLRPCFPDGIRNDVHVVAIISSVDQLNPTDIAAINGASTALMLSGIPFEGPVGAVRMAQVDGSWMANPTYQQIDESTFEMVVVGRADGKGGIDVLMVEAGATEGAFELIEQGAPEITEQVVAQGLEESKSWITEAITVQEELVAQAGVADNRKEFPILKEYEEDVFSRVSEVAPQRLQPALGIQDKLERELAFDEVGEWLAGELTNEFPEREPEIYAAFSSFIKKTMRDRVVEEGIRLDGRGVRDVRPISCEVSLLPRVHGSGLFNRGQTQVLSACTLGMLKMEQIVGFDDLGTAEGKRYMHHYNDPPFSYGEARFMRGPGRRAIGHGALAERALLPVVPSDEDFPYAIRVVSEVLSSNGSTSMASVCGSTLSLMDAGVPLRKPVGGIAMGLIKEGDKFVTLTDIIGAEDALGDMDFKVAGTDTMITALQLDTKIMGVPIDVLVSGLDQAKEARLFILERMAEVLPAPRPELNPNAPRIIAFKIPIDKIGEVIGPKGKRINEIIAETDVEIDIEDDGTVRIGAREAGPADEARRRIEEIANPRMPEVGEKFMGKVVKIAPFGAFVNLTPAKDGLVHISKLGGDIRLARVEDVLSEGDQLEVEVVEIDAMGKISLVPVTLPPRVAELPPDYEAKSREGRRDSGRDSGRDRDRGDRGGDRGRERPRRPRHRDNPRDE